MTRKGGFPLEWKCAGREFIIIGGSRRRRGSGAGGCGAAESARDSREEVRVVEPAAVVFDSRSADLAVHAGSRNTGAAGWIVRSQRTAVALVFADLVVAHHENGLVSGEGHRPRQDRYFEASCLRGESRLGDGYSSSLRLPSVSIPHCLQERIIVLPDCGLATEAVRAGLH